MRDEGEGPGEGPGRFQVEMFRQWVARHAVRSGMEVS